ncbi:MAG: DUF1080 domain-containing protein [Halioglobus sp.]
MRNLLKLIIVLLVLVGAVAAVFYQVYFKTGQYVHEGALASPPSESIDDNAWVTIFDGQTLDGWIPKLVGSPLGEDNRNTFRVQDGSITVAYDDYPQWSGEFGHLFYHLPFTHYVLQLEYRFDGEQIAEGAAMAWAWRNSGVMIHSQAPDSMTLAQDFPVSLEVQLLGAHPDEHRPTANLCTPGTHVELRGKRHTQHCMLSTSPSIVGDEWVTLEVEVRGDDVVRHFINGELVFEYSQPHLDTWMGPGKQFADNGSHIAIDGGYIALQSESHPVQFRDIRIAPLN